ncbi:MAG: S1C family serine protease [Planctomycetaceae bacterium]
MKWIAGCVLSGMMGGMFCLWLVQPATYDAAHADDRIFREGPRLPRPEPPVRHEVRDVDPSRVFNSEGLAPEEAIAVAVYERDNKSVVNITTTASARVLLVDVSSEGTGSGSIIDREGHILTNYHVIEGAKLVEVTLYDGETYPATLVGADPINDIAVIRISAPQEVLFPVEFGDSSGLRVGMRVFAIGNPFGLERTMTTGIISSLNRSLQIRAGRSIKSIIQIDAAVNPGNSGGPLFDSHGKLIGVNTAIASKNGQSAGVGFAIPINLVSRVVQQLITHGRVMRPEIGIQSVFETDHGVRIIRLTPNGPAERAGLRGPQTVRQKRGLFVVEQVVQNSADLIVGVDDQEIKTADDFLGYIESKRAGDELEVKIVREGKRMVVRVILGGGDRE